MAAALHPPVAAPKGVGAFIGRAALAFGPLVAIGQPLEGYRHFVILNFWLKKKIPSYTSIEDILGEAGYEVAIASDGEEALIQAKSMAFLSGVVMDLNLRHGDDGQSALRQL